MREGHPRARAQRVFPNLRRMHQYWKPPHPFTETTLFFISSLLSCFIETKYFHGNVGTYKIGELTTPPPLRFFGLGRSLEIHLEIKRKLFPWLYMNPQAPNISTLGLGTY